MKRLAVISALALGCSSGGKEGAVKITDEAIYLETGEFEIPDGESFECFYTEAITGQEYSIKGADGSQETGGHHIVAYYTTSPAEVGHHPCTEVEMVSWNMIAGAGAEGLGEGEKYLSDGLALKIPAGAQLVLQAHYINVDGAPRKVRDTIQLLRIKPEDVVHYANNYVVFDGSFTIPAQSSHTSQSTCIVESDMQISLVIGHMHEHGKHYTLEVKRPTEPNFTTLYDVEWYPYYSSHPPLQRYEIDAPLLFPVGTELRQTCTWDNTGTTSLAFPTEMCLSFMYYFPDAGEMLFCRE